jgi:hypothetical protein
VSSAETFVDEIGDLIKGYTTAIGDLPRKTFADLRDAISKHFGSPTPKLAARFPRVVIVGEGGAGKSTILKQMLAYAAQDGRVPVWVSLATLPANLPIAPPTLIEHLIEQARTHVGMKGIERAFFEALIEEGQLAIGFDALDECGSLSRQQRMRGLIVEVAREWKQCHVFVTSRPAALAATPLPMLGEKETLNADGLCNYFISFAPVPFTRADIRPFLRNTFKDEDGKLADKVMALKGVDVLTEAPLPLTLVALVARDLQAMPATRTMLFERCVATLCETWDEAKAEHLLVDGLSVQQRVDALRRIGWAVQSADRAMIDAGAAAAVLAKPDVLGNPARAFTALNALAQRNMLLRPKIADGPSGKLLALGFAHPQFREYLAGAYLADRHAVDREALRSEMASRWLDNRWLEPIRFGVTTLEEQSAALSDDLLGQIVSADDPYRDLLHRPELLVACLLASLKQAELEIVATVVATLEQVGCREPALRDISAELLLGLAHHEPGRAALTRFAKGEGLACAFVGDAGYAQEQSLRWRLRAIEALAPVSGAASALALLPAPSSRNLMLEVAELRARLGDLEGARAQWRASLCEQASRAPALVAASMDRAGEGRTFDAWLTMVPAERLSLEDLALAHERKVIGKDASAWVSHFERASAALSQLGEEVYIAPPEVSGPIYAALENGVGAASDAGRAFLRRALWHPALVWFVAPRVSKVIPEFAREAVASLVAYLETVGTAPGRPDWSRLNVAYRAVCDEPNDSIAVPALLRLLALPAYASNPRWGRGRRDNLLMVAESLRRRGQAAAGLEIVGPRLSLLLDGTDANLKERVAEQRADWRVASALDPEWTLRRVEACLGKPLRALDAERMDEVLAAVGATAIAPQLFKTLTPTGEDRVLLERLAAQELDPEIAQRARILLGGKEDVLTIAERDSWTLPELERAVSDAIEQGIFQDVAGREVAATVHAIVDLLTTLSVLAGEATALRHADAWVERLSEAVVQANGSIHDLADALALLTRLGLSKRTWLDAAARAAHARPPAEREPLVAWLSANA